MKIRLMVALITCKKCGADYNNRLKHSCVVGMDVLGVPASMRKARDRKRAQAIAKAQGR